MSNPLTRKLEGFAPLEEDDRRLLDEIVHPGRLVRKDAAMIHDGDDPKAVHLVLDGVVFRHKTSPDGRRQIVAYMIPGDLCDLYAFLFDEVDHDMIAATDCRIVDLTPERVQTMMERPRLRHALWWSTMVDASVLRGWIVNLGTRVAAARLAHFFCEIVTRLGVVGLAENDMCKISLTQAMLAETLGLSPVHINRSLQDLRKRELIDFDRNHLAIHDFGKLATYASFDPRYLHLKRGPFANGDRSRAEAAPVGS